MAPMISNVVDATRPVPCANAPAPSWSVLKGVSALLSVAVLNNVPRLRLVFVNASPICCESPLSEGRSATRGRAAGAGDVVVLSALVVGWVVVAGA